MLEHEEPVFFSRPLPQTALRLEGHERLEVVSHDPRQRKVRRGRTDVSEEAGGLVVAADERSGSLSTADYALEQGTPVFVPEIGHIPETAGIHRLRSRPEIGSLSLENLFTELSKSWLVEIFI